MDAGSIAGSSGSAHLCQHSGPYSLCFDLGAKGLVIAGVDYDKLGLVASEELNPEKSRVLLMLEMTKIWRWPLHWRRCRKPRLYC
jgi:L-asparaginase/Glu-tRNA(Gln) amidotransferase subunit D